MAEGLRARQRYTEEPRRTFPARRTAYRQTGGRRSEQPGRHRRPTGVAKRDGGVICHDRRQPRAALEHSRPSPPAPPRGGSRRRPARYITQTSRRPAAVAEACPWPSALFQLWPGPLARLRPSASGWWPTSSRKGTTPHTLNGPWCDATCRGLQQTQARRRRERSRRSCSRICLLEGPGLLGRHDMLIDRGIWAPPALAARTDPGQCEILQPLDDLAQPTHNDLRGPGKTLRVAARRHRASCGCLQTIDRRQEVTPPDLAPLVDCRHG